MPVHYTGKTQSNGRNATVKTVLLVCIMLVISAVAAPALAQNAETDTVEILSGDLTYPAYLAVPEVDGQYPAVILIHSFRGLEEGYKVMADQMAAEGFVVLAVQWQTFEQSPPDAVVKALVEDSIAYLSSRPDVDPERIGLTGFCAGGRYTMLLLPQIPALKAGVAWYGFPNNGDPAPIDLVGDLTAPMLIIHGTEDQPSPI
ncbi:MAG: dienelactone hydrolase family protein, partial [Anaerolineae bacterium]|nr:dienelactone hydrolase family protein [Anaerolineae bacterium]